MTLPPVVAIPLMVAAVAIGATLVYASVLDAKERRVPHKTWRPALIVAVPAAVWVYGMIFLADWRVAASYLILTAIVCGFYYLFGAANLFGGADACALIAITACIPLFPVEPWFGIPPHGFFPFAVFTNAVLINIAVPVMIFARNLVQRNRAPLPYLFLGFPVDGESIQNEFGFVMEDIEEQDGKLVRRFIGFTESLRQTIRGEKRIYTKNLRLYPEDYGDELDLYRKAGKVWISYGIPFIIPITAGYLAALLMGDILFVIITTLAGT